jgi:hypothetical protein
LEVANFPTILHFNLHPRERVSRTIASISCSFFSYIKKATKAAGRPAKTTKAT